MAKRKVDAAVDLIAQIQGATGLSSQKISRAMDALRAEGKPLTAENIFAHAGGNPSLLGPSKEYIPPPEAPQPGMERIQRTPLEERLYTDPKFKNAIEEFNPEFAARMQDATPEEIMDVYGGGPQQAQVDPFANIAPDSGAGMPREFSAMTDEQHARFVDDMLGARAERQMQLPLGDGPTGMVPYGVRGPGVPTGGVSGPGVSMGSVGGGMIPSPMRGLPGPNSLDTMIARLGPQGGSRPLGLPDKRLVPAGPRDLSVPRQADGSFGFEMAPPGGKPPGGGMIPGGQPRGRPGGQGPSWRNVVPGVVAGAVAGKYLADSLNDMKEAGMPEAGGEPEVDAGLEVMPDEPDALGADDPMATADLAAESRPLPDVAVEEAPAPVDPSLQARQLIDDLNARRRAAGGEVPDAPQVMAEVNRLMEMGNQTRRATYVAAPQDDAGKYFQQAQGMIDQVNQMYRQGMTPNSPEVRQMMAEVRRLQQMGDSLRNRRAG
jgi:hypothetical protein